MFERELEMMQQKYWRLQR